MNDAKGVLIKPGDQVLFRTIKFTNSDTPVLGNPEYALVKNSDEGLVVYNPACCEVCKDSYGCICSLDELLNTYYVEVCNHIPHLYTSSKHSNTVQYPINDQVV